MSTPPSIEIPTLDAVLDSLFRQDPPPQVVAIGDDGLFVLMPPSVPAKQGHLFDGRTSALQIVVAADLKLIIDTWERAYQTGTAGSNVHLLAAPTQTTGVYFVDARPRYGVFLGFVVGYDAAGKGERREETPIRPRMWTSRRDEFGIILEVDDAVEHILGWTRAELVGHRALEFVFPEDQPRAVADWMDVRAAPGAERRVRVRYKHRNGSWIWFEVTNHNLLADPAYRCVTSELIDISDEMAALEALRISEQLLRRLTEALPLGVVQCDAAGRVVYRNERLGEIVGNESAATLQEQFSGVAPADRVLLAGTLRDVLARSCDADLEITLRRNGADLRCSLNVRAVVAENGAGVGAIVCISDITEYARLRHELELRATHDALTGCRNRSSILAVLETLAKAVRETGSGLAVVFVDLDGFKAVNDRLGHAVGDELLRLTAARLLDVARDGDVVGRLGGDEFLVVCRDVENARTAVAIGNRIAAALSANVKVGTETLEPRASVGVCWTRDARDVDGLVAAADAAMYDSKREARGRASLAGAGLSASAGS